jgi:ABC-type branched-subunit amino acid transport system ATPase component
MKPKAAAILDFCNVALNARDTRFSLSLAPGDLALFEAGETVRASWLGDAALGLLEPVHGEVRFQGVAWQGMTSRGAEQCRRTVGRVWAHEEGAAWLQNLDVDENIQLAQGFDPEQSHREILERMVQVARRFELEELPRTRPSVTKRRTLQVAQWVRAFLPKELVLLLLDLPLHGAADEDAPVLLKNVEEARKQGTAVLWVEKGSFRLREHGVVPTYDFPEFPASLRPEI